MARRACPHLPRRLRFPHPRGDGPTCLAIFSRSGLISPPTWGWPGLQEGTRDDSADFPTHVGMARNCAHTRLRARRFPHPRGDGPPMMFTKIHRQKISPPTWGWPDGTGREVGGALDFPTHVGMARWWSYHFWRWRRFPHPRGDGPKIASSPDSRGKISPPTWGWPDTPVHDWSMGDDFPTHVGMARRLSGCNSRPCRFPHPRGDGPAPTLPRWSPSPISPPTWGWPARYQSNKHSSPDFPTHVGMARRRENHRR